MLGTVCPQKAILNCLVFPSYLIQENALRIRAQQGIALLPTSPSFITTEGLPLKAIGGGKSWRLSKRSPKFLAHHRKTAILPTLLLNGSFVREKAAQASGLRMQHSGVPTTEAVFPPPGLFLRFILPLKAMLVLLSVVRMLI